MSLFLLTLYKHTPHTHQPRGYEIPKLDPATGGETAAKEMINEAVILTKIAAEGRAEAGKGLRINGIKYMVRGWVALQSLVCWGNVWFVLSVDTQVTYLFS